MPNELMMRRLIWTGLMAASLLAAAPAMAETRVGAVGSVTMTDMTGPEDDFFVKNGWGAGGVVEMDLRPNLALASRPTYVEKGSGGRLLGVPGEIDTRMDLGYFELPLLVKLSAGTSGVRPYLIAGPSLGLRHKAVAYRSEFAELGLADPEEEREDIKQDTEPVELSLNVGVGVGLSLRRLYGFVEGIWAWGLTDVTKAEGTSKNRGVQFRTGITLRLGGR